MTRTRLAGCLLFLALLAGIQFMRWYRVEVIFPSAGSVYVTISPSPPRSQGMPVVLLFSRGSLCVFYGYQVLGQVRLW